MGVVVVVGQTETGYRKEVEFCVTSTSLFSDER